MAVFHDGKLVHRQSVVVFGVVEVNNAGLRPGDRAVGSPVLHRHAVHEHPVKRTVALLQGGSGRVQEFAEGVLERFRWEVGVQSRQRVPQALVKYHLPVTSPLGEKPIRGDFRPVLDLPAEGFKPGEGGGFDGGFYNSCSCHLFTANL
jgi:hypothetical protein